MTTKFLLPVRKSEWCPSISSPTDQFGRKDHTLFRIRARLNDGYVAWQSWFEDRDDFDIFLHAIATNTLHQDKYVWRLPNNEWTGELSENITFDFAVQSYLIGGAGVVRSFSRRSDWNANNNTVEGIGGGGSGGARFGNTNIGCTGGGGGAYARISNFKFVGDFASYQIGLGGTARNQTVSGGGVGNAGGATWFGSATDPGAGTTNQFLRCAPGGAGGDGISVASVAGGIAGTVAASWGQVSFAGGRGGNINLSVTNRNYMTGGGGAGGNTANGSNGGDILNTILNLFITNLDTVGGAGGATGGGTGGTTRGGAGSVGSNWTTGIGSGGGGGGRYNTTATGIGGGNAANYGAGGGGASGGNSSISSGAGSQGIIIVTYEPFITASLNIPNLGL